MGTPLIITGMHRSGTSLLANLLQEAGVAIGQELEAASPFNAKGHFEDVEFMELHRDALGGVDADGEGELLYTATAEQALPWTAEHDERARALVVARRDDAIWGFKDPRTTLFLDQWAALLPNARFVFIYRSPEFVVNSLRRRRDPHLFTSRSGGGDVFLWRRAADMWASYNRRLLRFLPEHAQQCVLLRAESLADDFSHLLQFLGSEWQLPVQPVDAAEVLDPKLMRSHVPPVLRWKTRLRGVVRRTLGELDGMYHARRPW